jgi:hypothetical protein
VKRYSWLPIFLCLCPTSNAVGQSSDLVNQGRRIAEQTVLRAEGESPSGRAQVIRREDLEQEVVELQYLAKYSDAKAGTAMPVRCIEIYQVTRAGIRVEDHLIVSVSIDVDDAPLWLVAYDCDAKEAIHLAGFPDDENGFNNLTKTLNLGVIDSESKALDLFSTFLKLSSPDLANSVVRTRLGLMSAVLSIFLAASPRRRLRHIGTSARTRLGS